MCNFLTWVLKSDQSTPAIYTLTYLRTQHTSHTHQPATPTHHTNISTPLRSCWHLSDPSVLLCFIHEYFCQHWSCICYPFSACKLASVTLITIVAVRSLLLCFALLASLSHNLSLKDRSLESSNQPVESSNQPVESSNQFVVVRIQPAEARIQPVVTRIQLAVTRIQPVVTRIPSVEVRSNLWKFYRTV